MRAFILAPILALAACAPRDEPARSGLPPAASVTPPPRPPVRSSSPPAPAPDSTSDGGWNGPLVPNAAEVVRAQIHPGAKRCYQRGLDMDPTQLGRIVIVIRVAGNGGVDSSRVAVNEGISAVVGDCIAEVARHAHFEPPGEPGSTISIPFNFVRASRDGGA